MLGLIDGNSFYCSCERAFNPALRRRAVVVLSNNDGCVIARTNEAKDLGLRMAEPWHLVRDRPQYREVVWMSSNYALYGDMSRRMFEVLHDFVPAVEPYSIDEMFLDLEGITEDLALLSARIRAAVRRIAKIPTCVGIGPTKTIAKLANKVAKSNRDGPGVCDFALPEVRSVAYERIPVADVWGLGPAAQGKLKGAGVNTVAEFIAYPADDLRGLLSVTGLRTQRELMGVSCFPFGALPATRKSLAVTRSFGRAITSWPEMREAVATYATRAAERLRDHRLIASAVQVFMHTNRFNGDPAYANQATVTLEPSNDSFLLIEATVGVARRLWRDGFRYAKAGVIFVDLCEGSKGTRQFFPSRDPVRSAALMQTLDTVNRRYGRDTLRPGGTGARPDWSMRRAKVSPAYTTSFEDLLEVTA
ncbi:MAG TPA: Y-family DNA polymerase [Burkholderiales bacterium]|nr:Y-family DNA polymerase [Burkholderiales bacterium]